MQVERWQQIKRLFHSILERPPDERAAILAKVCASDEELRREVESLLAVHYRGGSLPEVAASDLALIWLKEQEQTTVRQTLSHFRILSELGKGGMGEVYLAEDNKLRRKVALKLLPREFSNQEDRLRRFEQEARAASALNHPNILTIYEIDQASPEEGGMHFIATEFVEGRTLRALMREEGMQITTALDVAEQTASALEAAHSAGIIHRDIKPENIMMRNDGLVKVLDFGLAKLIKPPPTDVDARASTAAGMDSRPGVVMGTVAYMSPEQARGLEVDTRTDIFSLGVVLYEMIAGRAPFRGETASDVMAAILTTDPVPLSDCTPGTPTDLVRIVNRALKKDRQDQYNQQSSDILAIQEGIAGKIVDKLQLRLSVAEQQKLARHYTNDPEAYRLYLRGRHLVEKGDWESQWKAIEYFKQAIARDSGFALAYADIAFAYTYLEAVGAISGNEAMRWAKEFVTKALEIDNDLAEAHVYLGDLKCIYDWDWKGAEQEYKRALALNPNSAMAHRSYAIYFVCLKRNDEAIAEMKRALDLEPLSSLFNHELGAVFYFARRYDQTIEQNLKTIELDQNNYPAYAYLIKAYVQKGLYEQAITTTLRTYNPEVSKIYKEAYASGGWKGYVQKRLEWRLSGLKKRYISPYALAEDYMMLGDQEAALVWLEKAIEDRDDYLTFLGVDPVMDPLREDPRFKALLRRVRLEQ
ncbi:MAG: protein kinase [Acidobacteria bacterium]|nr:protein kinase [Acidobacteriota bacterium]